MGNLRCQDPHLSDRSCRQRPGKDIATETSVQREDVVGCAG